MSRFSILPFLPQTIIIDGARGFVEKIKHSKSTRRLNQDENRLVILNQEAYKQPELRKDIGSFKYLPHLSSVEIAVFKLEQNNTIYIIYKGTSNKGNVITDIKLITNIQDATFQRALQQYDLINRMFPKQNKIVSGHSLGSSKALFVSNKRNIFGVGFNTFTPATSGTMFNISRNTPQFTQVINVDDILSNKQLIINPPSLVVLVLQNSQKGFVANHSVDTLRFPHKYKY